MTVSASTHASAGPLTGLRVLELGSIVAASFAARLMADQGAEVIKIEGPSNLDPLREWGQGSVDGRGLWWLIQSRNKKLATLDLHTAEGQELFRDLAATSDVVIENFRPGTMERWNLDYGMLSQRNPALVLARISGFGQTGPSSRRPGFAAVAEAMSGMRFINGYPDQAPPRVGLSLGDSISGMFAVQGILGALYERERSGLGQEIDISLVESCLALMEGSIAEFNVLGKVRLPSGPKLPGVSPSNIFRTKDGKWHVIAASNPRMFGSLCKLMGVPGLAADLRFNTHEGRRENQDELEQIIADWAKNFTSDELEALLEKSSIAAGPVYSVDQVVRDVQLNAREAFVTHHDEAVGDFLAQNVTPRFSRTPGSLRWTGPWTPGAHNEYVFKTLLGVEDDRMRALRRARVI